MKTKAFELTDHEAQDIRFALARLADTYEIAADVFRNDAEDQAAGSMMHNRTQCSVERLRALARKMSA